MKEPGELAFDAWRAAYAKIGIPWRMLGDDERAEWAAVESAIRADERAKIREECAKVAESHNWMRDIEWWMNATKKEVSAVSAKEAAAAIRALGTEQEQKP